MATKPKGVGMARTFRWIWGILTLASCGWIFYGISATGTAVNQVISTTPTAIVNAAGTLLPTADPELVQAATAIGASIGGGLGLAFFLCSGIPLFLFFAFLYWRNGAAIRRAREHTETIDAIKAGKM